MVLFISSRRNGASLEVNDQAKRWGRFPGSIALFGCFLIDHHPRGAGADRGKALAEVRGASLPSARPFRSPCLWGSMRFLRPGRVGEVSVIGIVLLVASLGGIIAHDPYWGPALTFKDTTITFTLIGCAFISALLPVWLILAPRDYLATF